MCQLKNIFTTLINAFVFVGCLSVVVILTPELEAKTNFVNNDSLRTIMRKAEIADVNFFSKLDSLLSTTRIARLPYKVLCFGSESIDTSAEPPYNIYIGEYKPSDENSDIYIMVFGMYYPSDFAGDIIVRHKAKYYIFGDNNIPTSIISMRQDKCVYEYSIEKVKQSITIQPIIIRWNISGKMEELSPMDCPPW